MIGLDKPCRFKNTRPKMPFTLWITASRGYMLDYILLVTAVAAMIGRFVEQEIQLKSGQNTQQLYTFQ